MLKKSLGMNVSCSTAGMVKLVLSNCRNLLQGCPNLWKAHSRQSWQRAPTIGRKGEKAKMLSVEMAFFSRGVVPMVCSRNWCLENTHAMLKLLEGENAWLTSHLLCNKQQQQAVSSASSLPSGEPPEIWPLCLCVSKTENCKWRNIKMLKCSTWW